MSATDPTPLPAWYPNPFWQELQNTNAYPHDDQNKNVKVFIVDIAVNNTG